MKSKRYVYLIISTLSMCLYGLGYIWPVFAKPLEAEFQVTSKESSLVFTICLISFGIGCLVSGFLYGRMKLLYMLLIATVMTGGSILLTAKAPSIEFCYLTFGLIYGFGAGIGYRALLTTIISWFPEATGIVSGIMFMGCGLTAMVFNVPLNHWIETYSWRTAFTILAYICIAVFVINLLIVKPRPDDPFALKHADTGKSKEAEGMTTGQMLHTSRFWMFFLWCILFNSVSMAVSSNSVAYASAYHISTASAAFYSGLISLFSAGSRIIFGIIYDKKGRKTAMLLSMFILTCGISLVLVSFRLVNVPLLVAGYALIGLCLGAIQPIASSYILQTFGARYYSKNYSIEGLSTLVSTFIGPFVIGNVYAVIHSYFHSYLILFTYCMISIVFLAVLLLHSLKKA